MAESARAASKISLVLADVDCALVTAEKVLTPRARAATARDRRANLVSAEHGRTR
jgi:hypothetical protein